MSQLKRTESSTSGGRTVTLISTARDALDKSEIDAAWLTVPANSIEAGTAYIAQQLPATGFGEQCGHRLASDPQRMVAHDRRGVGVVRRHRRLVVFVRVDVGVGRRRQPRQRGPDPGCQLARRLVGEGQTQDAPRSDALAGNGMHDAGRHHHRLAGAGTRNDQLRSELVGRDGELVVGEVDAEQLAEIGAGRLRGHPAHEITCWPASTAGQDVR